MELSLSFSVKPVIALPLMNDLNFGKYVAISTRNKAVKTHVSTTVK